jgi:ketosteroid isomerase-like protein
VTELQTRFGDPAADRMVAMIERILAGISDFSFAGLAEGLTEDAVIDWPYVAEGAPAMFEGRQAIVDALAMTPKIFTHFRMWATLYIPSPLTGTLVVEAASHGQYAGGGPYGNRYVLVIGFRDGRVAHWREYLDPRRVASPA